MEITISYENQQSYGFGCPRHTYLTIKGKTLRSCLLQAFDSIYVGSNAQNILDYENEDIKRKLSDAELLHLLSNTIGGDGADFIYSIKQGDKILYNSGLAEKAELEITSDYDYLMI